MISYPLPLKTMCIHLCHTVPIYPPPLRTYARCQTFSAALLRPAALVRTAEVLDAGLPVLSHRQNLSILLEKYIATGLSRYQFCAEHQAISLAGLRRRFAGLGREEKRICQLITRPYGQLSYVSRSTRLAWPRSVSAEVPEMVTQEVLGSMRLLKVLQVNEAPGNTVGGNLQKDLS
jgi:hypothetical protein